MSGALGEYAIDVYMVGGSKLTLPIRDTAQAVSTMRAFQKIMGDSRGTLSWEGPEATTVINGANIAFVGCEPPVSLADVP